MQKHRKNEGVILRGVLLVSSLMCVVSCGSDSKSSKAAFEQTKVQAPSDAIIDSADRQMTPEQALELVRVNCLAKIPSAGLADRAFFDRQIASHEKTRGNLELSLATRDRSRRSRDSALEQRAKLEQRERDAQAAGERCEQEVQEMRMRLRANSTSVR